MAQEIASLLIFFRLWRIMRLMHGVAEAIELRHQEVVHQQGQVVAELRAALAGKEVRVEELQGQVGGWMAGWQDAGGCAGGGGAARAGGWLGGRMPQGVRVGRELPGPGGSCGVCGGCSQ